MFHRTLLFVVAVFASLGASSPAIAEPRLALVIGQGAYPGGELPTAVNDAGLVGQTLQSAGFEVIQGRDLNQNDLRRIVRDFLDGVQTATPDTTVVVYVSGHALQVEGENYLIPVDARIQRESDIPIEGYRVSDVVRSLSAVPGAVRAVIVDGARDYPLPQTAQGIARGLALVEPPPSFLIAFSAAPGTTAPDGPGPYGAYATALVEMMREPGIALDDLFARARLRTHEATGGRQTPWHLANLNTRFSFFEPVDATAAVRPPQRRRIEAAPVEEAYALAVEIDTMDAYQEFLRVYPNHPLAARVKVLLAARREAVIWRRTVTRNTPEAYWTYLRRYPRGPHAGDARRRLTRLSVPVAPPPDFDEVVYRDLPPPLPVEIVEVRETIYFDDTLPPPPPAPVYLLPPRDEVIVRLSAPPPPPAPGILPIPMPIPIPVRARPPAEFRPPIAPLTPQGPVTIPVVNPPLPGQPQPAQPRPGFGAGAVQPSLQPGAPSQSSPSGQPGLRAPITPLVQQQPQPGNSGPPAPDQSSAPSPGTRPGVPSAAEPRPGSLPPATAPGARPGAVQPGSASAPGTAAPAPGTFAPQPGTPGAPPAQRAGQPSRTAPLSAPTAGPSAPSNPQPRTPAVSGPAAPSPGAPLPSAQRPGAGPGQAPAAGPGAPRPATTAREPEQAAKPSVPAQRAPATGPTGLGAPAAPAAARIAPSNGPASRPSQPGQAAPAGAQGVARPQLPTSPDVPRPAPQAARPVAPPPAPVQQIQRPVSPPVVQPPRPAAPAPSVAQPAPQAAPPQAGTRPGAPAPAQQRPQQGGQQKCVLPNGQPCPPPR